MDTDDGASKIHLSMLWSVKFDILCTDKETVVNQWCYNCTDWIIYSFWTIYLIPSV